MKSTVESSTRPSYAGFRSLVVRGFLAFGQLLFPISECGAQEATDYAAHFNQGQNLMRQMRFHEATAEFREAVRLNQEYLPAQQALAVIYLINRNPVLAWKQVHMLSKSGVELPKEFLERLP
jgi:hypothetical protein